MQKASARANSSCRQDRQRLISIVIRVAPIVERADRALECLGQLTQMREYTSRVFWKVDHAHLVVLNESVILLGAKRIGLDRPGNGRAAGRTAAADGRDCPRCRTCQY